MKIVQFNERRWKVVDDYGNTLDDAQGYGFKTEEGARKCWWFKSHGGSKTYEDYKHQLNKWWHEHSDLYEHIDAAIYISMLDYKFLTTDDLITIALNYMRENKIEKPENVSMQKLIQYKWK